MAGGNSLNVPLLVGTVKNEWDTFAVAGELASLGKVIPVLVEIISDLVTTVRKLCAYVLFDVILHQATFFCPTSAGMVTRINAGTTVFRYEYQGTITSSTTVRCLNPLAIFPDLSLLPEIRASHGSELPLIFGTYNQSTIPATPTEISLARFLQSAWVGFARNPKEGLINLGWPAYNPNTESLALLGNLANATGTVFTDPGISDILCPNSTFLLNALLGFSSLPNGNIT